ncbi:Uncharacterized protein APZ42_024579 [Daphnia magna]|uniref:F-box/LRR-repeat protein n=1 Tax=Daphnia magna TaxID=35525 RepID=A0A0P6GT10_9CRUS|nr:Uncharacterized protein APZ42_024579 [Daphnia magna]
MAPKFPDEVNVFLVPHSRMKDLVGTYMDQLSTTDFRSNGALEHLLPLLENTFTEFKSHEHIENQYIMERLKQRLKLVDVTSQSVCNCHGDSQLVEILNLLRDGYTCTSKSISERINFGSQLQKAVSEFTKQFIPHMEEEEEIFQPMLMKYFAYEELLLLKQQVIQQHEFWKEKLLVQKETAENMLALLNTVAFEVTDYRSGDDEDYQETLQTLVELTCENISKNKIVHETILEASFDDLPEEMILHIFSYLNLADRTRCAQVNKHWNMLIYSPQLWKTIYPTNWAKGFYDFQYRDPYTLVESEWKTKSFLDDDDDISTAEEILSSQAEKEIQCYEKFVLNALVRIGEGVQCLVVAGGLHLSSTILHSMLVLCPNIQHLDASYTNITDLSFKGLALKKACIYLEHLDLTGCRFITDVGLERLGNCFKSPLARSFPSSKCGSCCQSCKNCPKYTDQMPMDNIRYGSNDSLFENDVSSPGLVYLSLSGCTSVTDFGLGSLLEVTVQKESLRFLDLSGCSLLSGRGLKTIAKHSSRLQPEDLYYCNRIQEGPYPEEANGCQNLECPLRGCCCFDQ